MERSMERSLAFVQNRSCPIEGAHVHNGFVVALAGPDSQDAAAAST